MSWSVFSVTSGWERQSCLCAGWELGLSAGEWLLLRRLLTAPPTPKRRKLSRARIPAINGGGGPGHGRRNLHGSRHAIGRRVRAFSSGGAQTVSRASDDVGMDVDRPGDDDRRLFLSAGNALDGQREFRGARNGSQLCRG